MSEEEMNLIRHEAGLDKPLVLQYFDWAKGLLRGDFGKSILTGESINQDLVKRIPITMHLGIISFILGLLLGIPCGIISAIRHGTWQDTLATTLANIGITIPIFWLGIMMIWFFGVTMQWLPVMGYTSPFEDFVMNSRQLIMPVICLTVFPFASNARQARSSMLEVLRQDYIRTAWAKGLRERAVILRHTLKNCLIPIVTLAGMGIASIIGGSVLIEQVFNIPGMGRLALDSLFQYDYAYVQGITLIITCIIVFANLLVDLSYGWLDPRIRYN
jgi:peptide/nickel transport system permease protein